MHDLFVLFIETMRLMGWAYYFSLLLLVLFLFQCQSSSTTAHGSVKFQNFETGSMSKLGPTQGKEGLRQNTGEGGNEDVFGDEKRKIYTGPNPLHNR